MKVAVAQFAIGADVKHNLATCLAMLDATADCSPELVVLPEFCNHLSWYEDAAHCHAVSLDLDGEFLAAIAARAGDLGCHVVINCTLRREGEVCTGSSLLYGPGGELLAINDKQVLIGHENDFLRPAQTAGPIVDSAVGRLGLYACMDGVINEPPRCLALRGAQVLCNSLNSFASDEGSLHIPVRAAENKVFVAAANKVGPLIPAELVDAVSAETGIPPRFLNGAGESQVVAPDGTVLARASLEREEFVYADIDPVQADNKYRPDGTDIFAARRPQLYQPLAQDPSGQVIATAGDEAVSCALVQLSATGAGAPAEAAELVAVAFSGGAQIAVLPPLFFDASQGADDIGTAREDSLAVLEFLAALCAEGQYIATTLVLGEPAQLTAVLVSRGGLVHSQAAVHRTERFAWSVPGDDILTIDLGFSTLALLTSDDACFPESFRLAALAGADTVIVPAQPLEAWEAATGLLERSAENRVNLLVAMQPSALGCSFGTRLTRDFTVMTPWTEREFDGLLSQPPVTVAEPVAGVTLLDISPRWADNKVVSRGTDLLAGRPWQLLDPLCAA